MRLSCNASHLPFLLPRCPPRRYQGVFPPATFSSLGLPDEWYGALEWQYPPHLRSGAYEEEGRAVNTLKGAIATADRIVTVSPTFSQVGDA